MHTRKKGKKKVQGVSQSQTAALLRHKEEKEKDKPREKKKKKKKKKKKTNKRKSNKRMKNTKISSLLPKWGNRNAKRTEKHNNKIT